MKSIVPTTNLSDSKQIKETLDSSIFSILEDKGHEASLSTNNLQLVLGILACLSTGMSFGFSDLEDLASDTLTDFGILPSTTHLNYTTLSESIPLVCVELYDFYGNKINDGRIFNPKLVLNENSFYLEFDDSFMGLSRTIFYGSEIISLCRQSDANGLYMKNSKQFNVKTSKGYFYKDSPFSTCLGLLFQFQNINDISTIFKKILKNLELMKHLRVIYNDWMICGQMCSDTEVKLISLSLQKPIINHKRIQEGTFVQQTIINNQPIINQNYSKEMKIHSSSKINDIKNEQRKSLSNERIPEILDMSKLNLVLPLSYKLVHKEVKTEIEKLLKEKKILVYQISNGLCLALANAKSKESIIRACKVLKTLSSYPNHQFTDINSIAKYIITEKKEKEYKSIQSSNNILSQFFNFLKNYFVK
eukprot:gene4205-7542_t